MKQLFKTILSLLLLVALSHTNAQDALWQLDFDSEVEWNSVTESGILLVGTKDFKLHGVDSRDGNILWTSEAFEQAKKMKGPDGKKVEPKYAFENFIRVLTDDEYEEVSDYVELKFTDGYQYRQYAVINIQTGEEVISPQIAEMPIIKVPLFGEMAQFNFNGTGYIPELRMVIISTNFEDYSQKGTPTITITKMVDLLSQKIIWTNEEIAVNGFPALLEDGDIVLPGTTQIAKMDPKTGDVKWAYNTEHRKQVFESFDLSLDLSTGYFFEKKKNSGTLSALDMKSGKKLWEQELKLKVVPTMSAMSDGVVVIDDKWFTMYDLQNGSVKWEVKKIDGYVVDLGEKGILATSKGKQLLLLNRKNGNVIWDQKIKGINIDQIAATGVMYTDIKGRLGYIQYDGELIWDKKGMLEVPSLRYKPELTKEIMVVDGDLFEIDLLTGDYKVLHKGLAKKFEGENASPESVESVAGGYLFMDGNNLVMLEPDGSVRFAKYWEAPGLSLAAKIALRAAQVSVMAMGAAAQMQSSHVAAYSRYGTNDYYSKMYAQQAQDLFNAAGQVGAEAKKKFQATVSKGDIRMILTRVGEGGQGKSAGLVKVDRRTGEELGTLLLSDKEPIYDYDQVSGQVFFKADKKQIISYSF
ncbi:PQQ-like domain-containing protein [Ekhidna lutea]|uniref:PQQ-like domain-containing protein n=1 Tax=Ekhidna lutea TaxID=447679 RepID=A0A239F4C7_EKHLU|nr:PQQ-binding-like beta-propeller repeat protein [Ekhidna lutea]SNS51697.1 PQQ-like domain-containing protein [Ekhidna lutea]